MSLPEYVPVLRIPGIIERFHAIEVTVATHTTPPARVCQVGLITSLSTTATNCPKPKDHIIMVRVLAVRGLFHLSVSPRGLRFCSPGLPWFRRRFPFRFARTANRKKGIVPVPMCLGEFDRRRQPIELAVHRVACDRLGREQAMLLPAHV